MQSLKTQETFLRFKILLTNVQWGHFGLYILIYVRHAQSVQWRCSKSMQKLRKHEQPQEVRKHIASIPHGTGVGQVTPRLAQLKVRRPEVIERRHEMRQREDERAQGKHQRPASEPDGLVSAVAEVRHKRDDDHDREVVRAGDGATAHAGQVEPSLQRRGHHVDKPVDRHPLCDGEQTKEQ